MVNIRQQSTAPRTAQQSINTIKIIKIWQLQLNALHNLRNAYLSQKGQALLRAK